MKIILDYKPTTQKSLCKICKKPLLKFEKRVRVDSENTYQKEIISYHYRCVEKTMQEFFNKKYCKEF